MTDDRWKKAFSRVYYIVAVLVVLMIALCDMARGEPDLKSQLPEKSYLYKSEKCGTFCSIEWGTPASDIRWLEFQRDSKYGLQVYDWKPNYCPIFHRPGKPDVFAHAESFEMWFTQSGLCGVLAMFTSAEIDKMYKVLSVNGQRQRKSIAELPKVNAVWFMCDSVIILYKSEEGNAVVWIYPPLLLEHFKGKEMPKFGDLP